MATTIKIKNSATPNSTPSSLQQGEMALNVTDGRLFYGSGSGNNVKEFTGGEPTIDTGSFATTGSNQFDGNQTITGSIKITGAVTASALSSSYIDLDVLSNGSIPTHKAGRIFFGAEDGALEVYNEEADITLQVGQEFWVRVYNPTASPIANGTPVRASGSQGDRIRIYPAVAENHTTQSVFDNHILGITTHEIEAGTEGYVTSQGIVRGVATDIFNAGDILYLQTGSAGFRNTPPPFPYDIIQVGYVARSASPNGFIFVEPKEPVHFNNISGLSGSASEPGDLWVYQANNAWSPGKTLSGSYQINNGGLKADSFTGSLQGNATSATIATTAATASYIIADNIDQPFTHITASGNISGSQTGSFAYLQLPGFEFDSAAVSTELVVNGEISGHVGTFEFVTSSVFEAVSSKGNIIKMLSVATSPGYLYYLNNTTWTLTDADAEGTSNKMTAYALTTNSSGGMMLEGMAYLPYNPGGNPGDILFLSTTAGFVSASAPTGTGDVVRIMGYKIDDSTMYFKPSPDYIVLS